jgi:hypothetical protein
MVFKVYSPVEATPKNNCTIPTIVPKKLNIGAIPATNARMDQFLSILYISNLPTFSILFFIASMGLAIR